MAYFFIILLTMALVMYSKGQFSQLRGDVMGSRIWHFWGWVMRAVFITAVLYASFHPFHWKDVVLATALSFPLFDIGLNLLALGQGIFYVGNTSLWDKKVGHFKWFIYLMLIILAIAIKVVPWNAAS